MSPIFSRIAKLLCFFLLGTAACLRVPASIPETAPGRNEGLAAFTGIWQDTESPDFFFELHDSQILIASSGRVREAATVLQPLEKGLLVCEDGNEVLVPLRRVGDKIEIFHTKEGRQRRLTRIDSRPEALTLALPVPDSMPLTEEDILAIQREIRQRREAEHALFRQRRPQNDPDQALPWLKEPDHNSSPSPADHSGIDFRVIDRYGANSEYMRNLVQKVGWIDAKRFGYPTSQAAFFLVQHSWDLALMQSVLPRIKKDVAAGLMDGSTYALMFDRVQLTLGRRQRFGSQIARNATGEVYVLPLEEPEGVDARRNEWGLQPLKEYVALFGASEVKISSECSTLTADHNPPEK